MKKYYPTLVENELFPEFLGKWAIGSGVKTKKFYPATVCDTKEEAEAMCVKWTLADLQSKMDEIYQDAVDKGILEDIGLGEYIC